MFKISFWEVYRQIYGRKLSFTVTCKWNCKNVISDCTSPNENFELSLSPF